MRRVALLLSFLSFGALARAGQQSLDFNTFGGLDTESPDAAMQPNTTPDAENIVSDLGPGLRPRNGFVLCQASSATASWTFSHSNGTRYQIIQSGGRLLADTGGCTFSITVSTVDASASVAAAVIGDKFFFMDTTNGLKSWDGTNVAVASATLKGSQLVNYKSRLWASVLTSDPRSIRASKFNDGTSWDLALDPTVLDPTVFVIGGQVDEPMTALYATHLGSLIWMKSKSFGAITGNSRADFAIRNYSDNVGTSYPDSIRDCDGLLRWLGPARTVYEWDGAKLQNIGKPIQTYLGLIGQGDANARTYTITSKTDYDTGTFYQKTSAITSGDIMLSTWTAVDTSSTDFAAGTTSNTSVIGNSVYLSTNNTDVLNNGFESAVGPEWTLSDVSRVASISCRGTLLPQSGSFFAGTNSGLSTVDNLVVQILDPSDNVLASPIVGAILPDCVWTKESINLSAYAGRQIKISASMGTIAAKTSTFLCSGSTVSFYAAIDSGGSSAPGGFDSFSGGRSSIYSGTFTSQAFNTTLSSAAWTPSGVTDAVNGSSIAYQTQSSSDGSTWQTAVGWSTGTAPASDFRQYIRYVITLSTGGTTNGTALPHTDDVTLSARANYGAYVSTAISLGSISSFGLFTAVTDADSGTVAYAVYSDSNTSMNITNGVPVSGFVSSQTITSGSYVTISTNAYIRIGETETITVSTNNPTNHSLALAWSEGNTTKVPSAWFRQRYWLGVAFNSATNNKVLVFDRNHQWQRYSGINASALGLYNGNLFFGNSAGVYQYESGTTDAGAAIAAYYRTPTFSPSSPNIASTFQDFRVTAENSSETLVTTYRVNDVATDYSFGSYAMNTKSGLQNFNLPFPITQIDRGNNVNFNFAVTGTTAWRILGFTLGYIPDRIPLD